jgi:hypothetical protein
VELKAKLMEEFDKQVPSTLNFSVGYFEGRQSTKKWLVSTEDLHAMYFSFQLSSKTDISLWCDGVCNEDEVTPARKRKRLNDDCPPTSKRAEKESEVDDVTSDLKGLHGDKYTEPQYRLWARMIINGLHSSRESPPNIPMITGFTPTRRSRQPIEETVASVVSATVKAMKTHSPNQQSSSPSVTTQPLGVSPSKVVDIRGKCLTQLGNLKQLFEDAVLTEDEWKEQKKSILETLRKL